MTTTTVADDATTVSSEMLYSIVLEIKCVYICMLK